MKTKLIPSLALACSLTCGTSAQTILSDNFNGNTINTNLWQASTPFSDSSITESGGNAVFQNRGRLQTAFGLPTGVDITGRFSFVGNSHDSFEISTRTDGITSNPYGYFDHGIAFGLSIMGDAGNNSGNVWIIHDGYPGPTEYDLARGTFSLTQNTFYNFRITDDGNNLAFFVGDLTTPLLTAIDSSIYGNLIGILNREGSGGGSTISAGSVVQLDFLTVQAIPEPSTSILALVGGLGVYGLRWRKNKSV